MPCAGLGAVRRGTAYTRSSSDKESSSGFVEWLMDFCQSRCPIGDVARDLRTDELFPVVGSFADMYAYLRRIGACYGALRAFEEAVRTFGGRFVPEAVDQETNDDDRDSEGMPIGGSFVDHYFWEERRRKSVIETRLSLVHNIVNRIRKKQKVCDSEIEVTQTIANGQSRRWEDRVFRVQKPPYSLSFNEESPVITADALDAKVSIDRSQFLRAVQFQPLPTPLGVEHSRDFTQQEPLRELIHCGCAFFIDNSKRACMAMNKYEGHEARIFMFLSLCNGPKDEVRPTSAQRPEFRVETYRGADLDVDMSDGHRIHMHRPCVYVIRSALPQWKEVALPHGIEYICIQASVTSAAGPKCFPRATVFKSPSGMFIPVEQLDVGSRVVASSGNVISVSGVHHHVAAPNHPARLVELITSSAQLVVTDDHAVATPAGSMRASELFRGAEVFVSGSIPAALVEVQAFQIQTDVYQIAFSPDEAVEACQLPRSQILSMGEHVGRACQRRTRRPGMNRRLERQADSRDQVSIPETFDSFA